MKFQLFIISMLMMPVISQAADVKVQEKVLTNGMKILVKEDHRSPVVVSQVWYKVGSSYEPGGVTGISHMLEHMMFKGTDKLAPGEFSRIITENGGNENAFTGRDYTAYFQTMEKSRLPISFELEADRMRNLNILSDELVKELQVVTEERRMRTDDKPRSKLQEHFSALAFSNSPYKNPVIGWPADIAAYTVKDLQAWYERWYAPNNATMVVVGDVDPQRVFDLAEQHFGPLKPSELDPVKTQTEVAQLGVRRMSIKLPAKLPYLLMGYKVPVLATAENEWEIYALEVLAGILDGGNSARLQKRLVRGQQIAVSAGAGYSMTSRLNSLFMLDATPAKDKTVYDLEYALKQEVSELKHNLVTPDEMARIKAQVLSGAIYERDSNFYQGMQLGIMETVGLGWQKVDEYVDKVNQVTAAQVREVARKYLIENHLTIAYLDPQPMQKTTSHSKKTGGRHAQ